MRAENTARCERLLARSARLDTAGISWDRAADVEIEDDAIASLVYMRDVESFTSLADRRVRALADRRADPA